MLHFDDNGLLVFNHHCEVCSRFPNPDPSEKCLICGYSQGEIFSIEIKVEAMNRAFVEFNMKENNEDISPIYRANLHLSNINLSSEDFDTITLSDINFNGDIRRLAELTDEEVDVIIIPTGIRHNSIEIVFGLWEDDEDDDGE